MTEKNSTDKNTKLVLIAILIVAISLTIAGCSGAFIRAPTPTPAAPTPTPIVTATPLPTPVPTITGPVDLIFTRPLESGANNTSAIHVLTGNITYNGDPAAGYIVLVDTVNGCEYGNRTGADGKFQVTFRDDWSSTYTLKIVDTSDCVIYADRTPRPVSETGPFAISIEVPSSKQIHVSIAP